MNILYLIITGMLDLPILYLSRYITHNKAEYYRLIQSVRDKNTDNAKEWEEWILFMLKGIEQTAQDTIDLVKKISALMDKFKRALRPVFGPKYNHGLLNGMFYHPYTKIEYVEKNLRFIRYLRW